MSQVTTPTEPGWLPDPSGRYEWRYWDGGWTNRVANSAPGTPAEPPAPATALPPLPTPAAAPSWDPAPTWNAVPEPAPADAVPAPSVAPVLPAVAETVPATPSESR